MKKLASLIIICFCVVVNSRAIIAPVDAYVFEKFGDICCDDEKARLDNFARALQSELGAKAVIIFYGGQRYKYPYCHSSRLRLPRRGEAEARAARLKTYLIHSRGIPPEHIVLINGGYRESWTAEFWIIPKQIDPPEPSPTIQPEEIKFRRGRARASDYDCQV